MLVLGTHVFDLMRSFAGDPISCRADVWEKGEPINKQHAREATESVGLIAGDEIEAQFTFPKHVSATFTSRARLRDIRGPWAVEVIGTKGIARILMDVDPKIYILKSEQFDAGGRAEAWRRFDKPAETGFAAANRRVVEDWLKAIEENVSRLAANKWNEGVGMVMAVYQSALDRSTAFFPCEIATSAGEVIRVPSRFTPRRLRKQCAEGKSDQQTVNAVERERASTSF
jgi:predicted dehydrogenase